MLLKFLGALSNFFYYSKKQKLNCKRKGSYAESNIDSKIDKINMLDNNYKKKNYILFYSDLQYLELKYIVLRCRIIQYIINILAD